MWKRCEYWTDEKSTPSGTSSGNGTCPSPASTCQAVVPANPQAASHFPGMSGFPYRGTGVEYVLSHLLILMSFVVAACSCSYSAYERSDIKDGPSLPRLSPNPPNPH